LSEHGFREELVYTYSEDGFRLDGVVMRPEPATGRSIGVVLVHGLYAAFYSEPMVGLARGLASRGYTVVSGNNRGHDFGAVLRTQDWRMVVGGGGWERLEVAPLDIGAWVAFLRGLGCGRVVLLGHSLGARKVVWYEVSRQDPAVCALVLASPRILFGPDDTAMTAIARRMTGAGMGQDLLPWPENGCSMSAATYLDHEETGALFRHLLATETGVPPVSAVRCPILAFFGGDEVGDGRDPVAELEALRGNASGSARVDTAIVADTDHMYTDHEAAAAARVAAWLDSLSDR
jgi:pimeloyl-ACP methyl ester carboxylesterase